MWNDPNDILNQNQSKNMDPIANALATPVAPTPVAAPTPIPAAPIAPAATQFSPLEKEQDITKGSQTATSTTTTPATENISTSTQSKTLPQDFYKAQADYAKATEAQKKAAGSMADVEVQQANEMATFQEKVAADAQLQAEERKKIAKEEYDNGIKYLDDVDKKTTDLLNKKYEGFWSNKAAGTKIISALAVAAGAYGAALSGTSRNFALDIVQKEMDDDFRNFKENQNQQIQAINNSKLTYEAKQKLLGQLDSSRDAYQLAQREQIKAKADALAAKFKAPEAQAKLSALVSAMDKDIAAMNMNIQQGLSTTVSQNIDKRAAQTQTTTSSSTTNNAVTKTKSAALQKDAAGNLIKPATKEEIDLTNRYDADARVKNFKDIVKPAYETMTALAKSKTKSKASDITLIYQFMKLNDPTSVVRESEFAMAGKAGSLPETIQAYFNQVSGAGMLDDNVRNEIVEAANVRYQVQANSANEALNEFKQRAGRYGYDTNRAFGEQKAPTLQSPQTSSPYQVGQVVDGYTFLGGDFKDQNNWRK